MEWGTFLGVALRNVTDGGEPHAAPWVGDSPSMRRKPAKTEVGASSVSSEKRWAEVVRS